MLHCFRYQIVCKNGSMSTLFTRRVWSLISIGGFISESFNMLNIDFKYYCRGIYENRLKREIQTASDKI